MRRLLDYVARYRWRYLLGVSCLLVTATLAMSIPYLLKRGVDAIATGAAAGKVAHTAALIALIAAVQGVVRTFSRFLIFNVGRDVEYDLRNDLFAHLERLPLAFYRSRQTGDLMSRLVNDIGAVRMLLGPGFLNFINTPVYYVYALAIMLSIDARLSFAALLPYPLLFLLVKRYSREFMERTLRVQESLADLSSRVQENLAGGHVVRAYAREAFETEQFARLSDRFKDQSVALARMRALLMPVMKGVGASGVLIVLWYGGGRVAAGDLTLGDLVAFIGYLHMLAWPTMALGWMLSVVQRGRAAMQRLGELFAAEPGIHDAPGAAPPPAVRGEIALEDVEFTYPGADGDSRGMDRRVLRGVSLEIPAGSVVAVVGRTGAGKSTLVSLLPRLFDVDAGAVRLDGRDVRTFPLRALRRALGVVPQDPFLFSTTVRENVAFGLGRVAGGDDASLETRVLTALRAAGLEREVAELPRGLDTVIGERGVTLSGGQKQRLTLARALAAEPRVVILDDALSSVDAETERQILARLRTAVSGRTAILISHRVTTIKDADLIAVLDQGRVVEVGDHATLLARGGLYAEIFRQGALAEELEAI